MTPSQKLRSIADSTGLDGIADAIREIAEEIEHNNAPAVPQGWTDADSDAARLALELECLLMDTKDLSVVSKWWGSANDALELHRQRLAATPAPAPAQEVGLTDEAVNDAARVLAERFDYPWEHMPEEGRKNMRTQARAVVIAALRAKGGK